MADRFLAVLAKVVATRVDVDALSGAVTVDPSSLGVSAADRAALAVAVELARPGEEIVVVSVGTAVIEPALAELAACGADRAVRLAPAGVDAADLGGWRGVTSDSVARVLAAAVTGARVVVAGDHSLDRGSGSVPAGVAHHLGAPQALGVLGVDAEHGLVERRVAGGWRERLALRDGLVISVEASAGRPGRASPGALRAARVEVVVVEGLVPDADGEFAPYRPAPTELAAPSDPLAARRALETIGALVAPRRREVLELDPAAAADALLARLAAWGYR